MYLKGLCNFAAIWFIGFLLFEAFCSEIQVNVSFWIFLYTIIFLYNMKTNQTSQTFYIWHSWNTVCVLFLWVSEPNRERSNNAFLKITFAFFARRLNVLSLVPISGLSDKLLLSFYPSFHFCWFQLLPVPLASTIQVSNNLSEITQNLESLRT